MLTLGDWYEALSDDAHAPTIGCARFDPRRELALEDAKSGRGEPFPYQRSHRDHFGDERRMGWMRIHTLAHLAKQRERPIIRDVRDAIRLFPVAGGARAAEDPLRSGDSRKKRASSKRCSAERPTT